MKKGCLSEEIFEVISNEESHYKRDPSREQSGSCRIRMTKTHYFAESLSGLK